MTDNQTTETTTSIMNGLKHSVQDALFEGQTIPHITTLRTFRNAIDKHGTHTPSDKNTLCNELSTLYKRMQREYNELIDHMKPHHAANDAFTHIMDNYPLTTKQAIEVLKQFMSKGQMATMVKGCKGEEKQYFIDKLVEMAGIVDGMAKTYEQDGKGTDAIVYLHYFINGMDWHITEKDMEPDRQLQAFGHADLGMGFPEVGYICIDELIANNVELDLHFTPKTLKEALAG